MIPVNNDNEKHLNDVDGDADVLGLLDEGQGAWLGATTERKLFFHKNQKNKEKKAVLVSVWLKESY